MVEARVVILNYPKYCNIWDYTERILYGHYSSLRSSTSPDFAVADMFLKTMTLYEKIILITFLTLFGVLAVSNYFLSKNTSVRLVIVTPAPTPALS